jgi:hypothetical protein
MKLPQCLNPASTSATSYKVLTAGHHSLPFNSGEGFALVDTHQKQLILSHIQLIN